MLALMCFISSWARIVKEDLYEWYKHAGSQKETQTRIYIKLKDKIINCDVCIRCYCIKFELLNDLIVAFTIWNSEV